MFNTCFPKIILFGKVLKTTQPTDDDLIQCIKGMICMVGNEGKNTQTHSYCLILIIVNSGTECSATQQCKGNQFLHFDGNGEHFYMFNSFMYASNINKAGIVHIM
jgi:hypothetical protein